MENNDTPLRLLDLNVSEAFSGQQLHYQLVDPGMSGTVAVDSYSGEVYLIASLDRETRSRFRFKVRRPVMSYPGVFNFYCVCCSTS